MAEAVDLRSPSIDIDRQTGGTITGWAHVVQSLQDIFTTNFGERVMREWYGSMVPRLLGENMNEQTIVGFFSAVATAIEQWEPRYRITRIQPIAVDRLGKFTVEIEGEYRPRALLGDFSAEGARRVTVFGSDAGLRAEA